MTTPTGDNASLYELELDVRTELTLADTRPPGEEADAIADEWMLHPDAQRYEVRLRTLLGAVEAVEGRSGEPPRALPPTCTRTEMTQPVHERLTTVRR
jgi:hypothetical protein